MISKIGIPFKHSDDKIGRKRGDAFSTGFPIFDSKNISKQVHKNKISTDRFITIFVVDYRSATNEVYGALAKLGFINAWRNNRDGGIVITLTKEGRKFNNIMRTLQRHRPKSKR